MRSSILTFGKDQLMVLYLVKRHGNSLVMVLFI